jgi:hypothetical protein
VAAAVAEAGLVSDEDLIRAEDVAVLASRRWAGDPRADGGADQVADVGHVGQNTSGQNTSADRIRRRTDDRGGLLATIRA